MERNSRRLQPVLLALLAAFVAHELEAGTRMIPPPPPRHRYAEDRVSTETSSFGQLPPGGGYIENTRGRFSALEDEEGREISFSDESGTYRRPGYRAPAGLEVKGAPRSESTATAPVLRGVRPGTSRATADVPPVSESEVIRQEERTEKFISDLQDPVSRRKGVQEVAVIASDLGFFPKAIFVSRDVPVRLFVTGAAKGSLCLMMDSFNVRKQIRANKIEEITFTPNQPGTYRFYCPVNGSEGTLVVKELSTADSGT